MLFHMYCKLIHLTRNITRYPKFMTVGYTIKIMSVMLVFKHQGKGVKRGIASYLRTQWRYCFGLYCCSPCDRCHVLCCFPTSVNFDLAQAYLQTTIKVTVPGSVQTRLLSNDSWSSPLDCNGCCSGKRVQKAETKSQTSDSRLLLVCK